MPQTRNKNRLIRRGIIALALLAALPARAVAAGQTFDEAVAAYGRGDYATAVRGFLVHAEQGNTAAQGILGVMYTNGEGVLKDDAEAVRWYRKAAEQGLAQAQWTFGDMYANGEGVPEDDAEAVRWYRKAAEQGLAQAQMDPRRHVRQRLGCAGGRCRGRAVVPQGRRSRVTPRASPTSVSCTPEARVCRKITCSPMPG